MNVEGSKPLKRLPGHESGAYCPFYASWTISYGTDVTDVAWSPEDRYLASVGLDSAVMIWDGFTLGNPSLELRYDSQLNVFRTCA